MDSLGSVDTGKGREIVSGVRVHAVVVGFTGKVTMVMMTLSAFLRRKARRISTVEFLSA